MFPIKVKMKYDSLDLKAGDELFAKDEAELRNLTGRGGQIVDDKKESKKEEKAPEAKKVEEKVEEKEDNKEEEKPLKKAKKASKKAKKEEE
jgi:hypothetical protein